MRAMHNEIRFDIIRKNIDILFAHDYLLELVPNRQQVNVPLHIAHTLHNNVKTTPIKSMKSDLMFSWKNKVLNQMSDEIHELIIGEIAVPLLMLRRDVTKQLYQQLYTNITNKSEP